MNSGFDIQQWMGRRIGNRWIQKLMGLKTEWQFRQHYGDFHLGTSYKKMGVRGLSQESGQVYGAIVKFLRDWSKGAEKVLLAGDNNSVKPVYAEILGVDPGNIVTAGILDEMDLYWDFEGGKPDAGPFDCIVSQSMFEHLIDPYRHFLDCVSLLKEEGVLVIHTMMPGFDYHRYPIDCMRFYPDWFETIAQRNDLVVLDKYIHNARITYALRKP